VYLIITVLEGYAEGKYVPLHNQTCVATTSLKV